jgi:hypothetical protein
MSFAPDSAALVLFLFFFTFIPRFPESFTGLFPAGIRPDTPFHPA